MHGLCPATAGRRCWPASCSPASASAWSTRRSPPRRSASSSRAASGMASGINSTFRQVGIATGIAAWGAIFQHVVAREFIDQAARGRPARRRAARRQRRRLRRLRRRPPQRQRAAAQVAETAFDAGLNHILLIAAIVALVGAVLSAVLVRPADFVGPRSARRRGAAPRRPNPCSDMPSRGIRQHHAAAVRAPDGRRRPRDARPRARGRGPGLLLLHGWARLAPTPGGRCSPPRPRASRRAIAVDLPGFGRPTGCAPAPMLPQLDALRRRRSSEELRPSGEPVVVAGNSLGGARRAAAGRARDLPLAGVVPVAPAGLDMRRAGSTCRARPDRPRGCCDPGPGARPRCARAGRRRLPRSSLRRPRAVDQRQVVGAFAGHHATAPRVARCWPRAAGCCPSSRRRRSTSPAIALPGPARVGRRATGWSRTRGARACWRRCRTTRVELLEGCGHCPQLEAHRARSLELLLDVPRAGRPLACASAPSPLLGLDSTSRRRRREPLRRRPCAAASPTCAAMPADGDRPRARSAPSRATCPRRRRRAPAQAAPVLLVPPLAAPAICFDLRRSCSLAEHLRRARAARPTCSTTGRSSSPTAASASSTGSTT